MLSFEQAKIYMGAYRVYSISKRALDMYRKSKVIKIGIFKNLVSECDQNLMIVDFLGDIIKAEKPMAERILIQEELSAYENGIDFWRAYVGVVDDSALEYIYDYVRSSDYTDANFATDFENDILNLSLE